MYKFKKTDSKELELTIAIIMSAVILLMMITYLLQFFDLLVTERASISMVVLVMGAFLLLFLDMRYLFEKENHYFTVFDVLILLSFGSLVISTLFAQDIRLSMGGFDMTEENVFVLGAYLVIGYSASLISSSKARKIIYISVTILAIVQVVAGLCQTVIYIPKLEYYFEDMYTEKRAFGLAKNANPYGSLMALFICIELGLIINSEKIKEKIVHSILGIMYTFCLVLSATRGAMLGCVVAICLAFVLLIKNRTKDFSFKTYTKKIAIIGIVMLIIVALCAVVKKDVLLSVIERTAMDLKNGSIGEDRLLIWEKAIERTWHTNPIIGVGVSNVYVSWFDMSTATEGFSGAGYIMATDAHSRYVGTFANQGFLGLVIYVTLLVYIFVNGVRGYKKEMKKEQLGLLMAFVAFAVADIFCIGMCSVVPLFYIVIGLIVERKSLKRISL